MNGFQKNYDPSNFPADELSLRERQLLQAHLDAERIKHWNRLTGRGQSRFSLLFGGKKMLGWAAAAGFALAVCWNAGFFSEKKVAAPLAQIDYPFEPANIRGESSNGLGTARSDKAVAEYRSHDYLLALKSADLGDHFFRGMCHLQLNEAAKALAEWDQMQPPTEGVGDEIFYFRGVALKSLGRPDEARASFERVLGSKNIREPYLTAAREQLGE